MLDHAQKPRISAEQVLPEVGAALHEEFLILPVRNLAQPLNQEPVAVVLNQAVPVAAPDALDHVPAGATENGFKFLNNFPVAAYRSVEPLQRAVDHPDQVVEFFARSQRDRAE